MGITGLLPFLDNASRKTHVAEFKGCTAAVDAYCWLHRGTFGCAEKIINGEHTNGYVLYCMKYVKMLQSYDVRPILVFDGQELPAKKMTEIKRRRQRELSRKKAAYYLRLGKINEARTFMRQCVDVTHAMALDVIKECRRIGVDCIVAPYEADAQLAFLNMKKMAHFVITEDSDLLLFGCDKVFFKMDLQGCGTLVEADKINKCMKLRSDAYTFDKFRHMSILSGCDYLENLPGVGLKKALKFISSIAGDTHDALVKLPAYLKLPNLTITNEYKEAFMLADATFKHQLIYDPVHRKLSRLNDPHGTDLKYCANAGDAFDDGVAFQLALGNIDPFTRAVHDDWSPDPSSTHASSIWATCYRKPPKLVEPSPKLNGPVTKGAKVNVTTKNGEFRPQTEEIKREPFRIKFSFKNKISKVDTQSVTTSRFFSKCGEKQNGYNMPNYEFNKSSLETNYIQLKNNGVGAERQEIKSNVEDEQLASFKEKIKFNKRRCVSTVPSALLQSETDVEKSTEGRVQNEGAIETQITRNVQLEEKTTRPKIASCRRLGLPRPKNKPRPKNLSIFGNMENIDSLLQ